MFPPGQCPRSVAIDLPAPPPNGTSQCPFTAALPSASLSSNVPFQSPRIRSQPVSPPGRAVPPPSGSGPQSTPSKWHLHSPFVLSVSSWTAFPRSGSGTRSRAVTSPPPLATAFPCCPSQRPFPWSVSSRAVLFPPSGRGTLSPVTLPGCWHFPATLPNISSRTVSPLSGS